MPKKRFPDPGERLLAIRTVNHNVNYMYFEGKLDNGDDVKVVDYGICEIIKWSKNVVIANVHGKREKGTYIFVRMVGSSQKQDNWLIIGKRHD